MKKLILSLVLFTAFLSSNAQSVIGAWESTTTNDVGESIKSVVIITKGYQVLSMYNITTGEFIHTNGGSYSLNGDLMTEKVEFDSDNPERVGTEVSFQIKVTDNTLEAVNQDMKLTKIDDGTPGELQGAWLMSGRIKDGETQKRDTSGPRKTMKILSGTRFQWIAYNTETKQFMDTGGGTYATLNGEYVENIEFFSKDDSRVGASLLFNFELIDGDWHHSGLSSKGDPIHEIWSLRE